MERTKRYSFAGSHKDLSQIGRSSSNRQSVKSHVTNTLSRTLLRNKKKIRSEVNRHSMPPRYTSLDLEIFEELQTDAGKIDLIERPGSAELPKSENIVKEEVNIEEDEVCLSVESNQKVTDHVTCAENISSTSCRKASPSLRLACHFTQSSPIVASSDDDETVSRLSRNRSQPVIRRKIKVRIRF